MVESSKTFTCLGGECTVVVGGAGPAGGPAEAVIAARDQLLEWHERFSRFKPGSELSVLNHDPRERVPVSPMMARFVQAAADAATATGGLVDATLLDEIEDAGYREDRLRGRWRSRSPWHSRRPGSLPRRTRRPAGAGWRWPTAWSVAPRGSS